MTRMSDEHEEAVQKLLHVEEGRCWQQYIPNSIICTRPRPYVHAPFGKEIVTIRKKKKKKIFSARVSPSSS